MIAAGAAAVGVLVEGMLAALTTFDALAQVLAAFAGAGADAEVDAEKDGCTGNAGDVADQADL